MICFLNLMRLCKESLGYVPVGHTAKEARHKTRQAGECLAAGAVSVKFIGYAVSDWDLIYFLHMFSRLGEHSPNTGGLVGELISVSEGLTPQ